MDIDHEHSVLVDDGYPVAGSQQVHNGDQIGRDATDEPIDAAATCGRGGGVVTDVSRDTHGCASIRRCVGHEER